MRAGSFIVFPHPHVVSDNSAAEGSTAPHPVHFQVQELKGGGSDYETTLEKPSPKLHDVGNLCTRLNVPYVLSDARGWVRSIRGTVSLAVPELVHHIFARCHDHHLIFVHGLKEPVNSDSSSNTRVLPSGDTVHRN